MPWLYPDGRLGSEKAKGFLCPEGSLCVEGENPYSGTISFDHILHSLQLVFVIMSSNTFSDIMYSTTDSDYLAASCFFIAAFVVLSLWLVNLLVAVITSSFQVIREERKGRSAFKTGNTDASTQEDTTPRKVSTIKRLYDKSYWIWLIAIAIDLMVQCSRDSKMGANAGKLKVISRVELFVTIFLAIEIFLRFLTDWRRFHRSYRNWVDLALVIATVVIQIPAIKNDREVYMALTIFQILRIYRIVLAFPMTRDLIMTVFSNVSGLLNLVLFVAIITLITAIFAMQLFRHQIPVEDSSGETTRITFHSVWNAFIGMYQVLSSEDWTSIMYSAQEATHEWDTAWISAMFFIMWFILSNFIVLNMFIAVIQESFDVSEDEKRLHQVKAFLQQKQISAPTHGNLAISSIFRLRENQKYQDPLDRGPAALEMLMKDAVVQDFLDDHSVQMKPTESNHSSPSPGFFANISNKIKARILNTEPNPFYSKLKFSKDYDDLDPSSMAKEVISAADERKRAQRQYLQRYPNYNVSLFAFQPDNGFRRACQRVVGPGRGNIRIEGVDPIKPIWFAFSAFIYAAIVAMVVIACITTPIYQRTYYEQNQVSRVKVWFVWTDIFFACIFTTEAFIKVCADGFFWTPNAYFRNSWGLIDAVVLLTLWVNVVSFFHKDVGISRFIGAFKALRALRLLNVSDSARKTFHAVIIMGGWKVISVS